MITSANVHPDMKKIENAFQTSPSLSMTGPSDLPASSSSLTMEGWQDFTAEPRERRRHKSLNCMLPLTTPLTSQWSCSLPGSVVAFGATGPHMPSSKMLSMTSTTGDSLPTSIDTSNTTRRMPTSSRSWTSWKQSGKASLRAAPLSKSASSHPNLQKRSNILLFTCLWAPFNQGGKGGAHSSCHNSYLPRDEEDRKSVV